jgi:hypothetical protein
MTRSLALAGLLALTCSTAFAQTPTTPRAAVLTTRTGHDVNVSVQHYDYTEPMDIDVSIHGPKFGAEYTGTFSLSERRHWFAQVNLRATGVTANYDGSCRPWQIVPSSTTANGYRLTLGAASKCSDTGNADWYVDGRALIGKDVVGRTASISPFTGVGVRHLSNGTTGNFNYRTQEYLYIPVGATLRTTAIAERVLGITVEYDYMLRRSSSSSVTGEMRGEAQRVLAAVDHADAALAQPFLGGADAVALNCGSQLAREQQAGALHLGDAAGMLGLAAVELLPPPAAALCTMLARSFGVSCASSTAQATSSARGIGGHGVAVHAARRARRRRDGQHRQRVLPPLSALE